MSHYELDLVWAVLLPIFPWRLGQESEYALIFGAKSHWSLKSHEEDFE